MCITCIMLLSNNLERVNMTYHANHSWCSESCWNNESFDSETMVYFSRNITLPDILENNKNVEILTKLENPDFENLIIEELLLNEKDYLKTIEIVISNILEYKKLSEKEIEEIKERYKESYFELVPILKPEIINWLNENIKDVKNTESIDLQDIKGWCIGNNPYRTRNHGFNIFFKRELDALKFIRKFSVFKEPIFYFDYFSDDRRNMDLNKIIHILKLNDKENKINIDKIKELKLNNKYQGNVTLDPLTFRLLDFDKEEDNIELVKTELNDFVKELYQNENTNYVDNNIIEYENIFELTDTKEISLGYEIVDNDIIEFKNYKIEIIDSNTKEITL